MRDGRKFGIGMWGGVLGGFILLTLTITLITGVDSPRLAYLWVLFAVSSSPLIFICALQDRYAILWIMMAMFFMLYGASDFLALFSRSENSTRGILTAAEVLITVGAMSLLIGYIVVARGAPAAREVKAEWSVMAILCSGAVMWLVGVVATLYWQIGLQTSSFKLAYVSPAVGMAVTFGRMVQPLGTALLAYRTIKSNSKIMLVIMIALLATEFVVGFICDSKELSIRGMIILLATKMLIQGRLPKAWLAVGAVVTVLSFPVFQAYRYEVLGIRGQAREQAARNLEENLAIAIKSIAEPNVYGSGSGPGFIGRVSLKSNIELILDRVGSSAGYQYGYTYFLFLEGFIPRVFWPDKPDSSVGQLFNRELHISAFKDVYISPSYLGEAYWNFGWPGVIVCMFLLGCLLGKIGSRVAMSEGVTVSRFLVLLLTIYLFCMRFEGGIALEALVWVRSLGAVGVLHWLFSKTNGEMATDETDMQPIEKSWSLSESRFGNLMR